ncbi:hypothetical protein [Streptomyces sp. NPDC001292]|uniref:hypothetical protein n=1 Tax=Streptomyces sp. NPDC001292 TaxID=3364558 RepID=UPI0036B5F5C9
MQGHDVLAQCQGLMALGGDPNDRHTELYRERVRSVDPLPELLDEGPMPKFRHDLYTERTGRRSPQDRSRVRRDWPPTTNLMSSASILGIDLYDEIVLRSRTFVQDGKPTVLALNMIHMRALGFRAALPGEETSFKLTPMDDRRRAHPPRPRVREDDHRGDRLPQWIEAVRADDLPSLVQQGEAVQIVPQRGRRRRAGTVLLSCHLGCAE